MPIRVRFGHRFARPIRHRRHVPSDDSGFTATTRPTRPSSTLSPVSTTVPANSWPITRGGARLPILPRYPSTSEPQIPAASGRTISTPSSNAGSGTSSTAILSGPCHTTAFMGPLFLREPAGKYSPSAGRLPRRGGVSFAGIQYGGDRGQRHLRGRAANGEARLLAGDLRRLPAA